jgi:HAD superfamily hydrolase (TIGR01549 family)
MKQRLSREVRPGNYTPLMESLRALPQSLRRQAEKIVLEEEMKGLESSDLLIPPSTFEKLKELGAELYVLSANKDETVQAALEKHGIKQLFTNYAGRNNEPMKPHPASVKNLLGEINFDEALMVGDSSTDEETCRKSGIKHYKHVREFACLSPQEIIFWD